MHEGAFVRAAALGGVTGMRAMMGPTILAVGARRGALGRGLRGPWSLFARPATGVLFGLAEVGELIADKLPNTPSRLAPSGLVPRLLLGAIVGAAAVRGAWQRALGGALIGAAAAAATAFVGNRGRAAAVRATSVPDPVWAILEDGLAVGLGISALRARS